MMTVKQRLEEFCDLLGVWEEARPYLHLMVNDNEMKLVVALGHGSVTKKHVAQLLKMAPGEAEALLTRCYRRHLVDRVEATEPAEYIIGRFDGLLNHFAMYEGWDEIPIDDRRIINRRFLDEFIANHRQSVEHKMEGSESENALPNDAVMLLAEAEEMIRAATHIVLQPCDCRRLGQNCDRPVETCIWFDELALGVLDRGNGRRVTADEAIAVVNMADKKGLMHTGDTEWRTRGLHALCNCCACDCYPFRAAAELGSKGVWPKSRYVAEYHRESCHLCGLCVRRCHFRAFDFSGTVHDAEGKTKKDVVYDASLCWGCGLCANTCPTGAITMVPTA